MTVRVHWFLPTAGDSRDIAPAAADGHHREPTLEHMTAVARAADDLGFDAVLTPTGTWCEDAWVTTAALIPETRRLRFLVAFRPGLIGPTLAAQMASTFQRLSNGRLLLNVVTGGDDVEQRRFGDWLGKRERYERAASFLEVLRGAWGEQPFDFESDHHHVVGATTRRAPSPTPEIYFGGASDAAERVAARHADVYLTWGEPPAMVGERVERMRALADAEGRTLRFGIRLHVIARDTAAEAWAETERLLETMDPEAVRAAQQVLAASGSEGQRRMTELTRAGDLTVAPNLWAGVGLVRGGAGTALVGSHDEVADRIAEYHALGFDEFILSGHPHLEEAYRVGEGLLPRLRDRGLLPPADDARADFHAGPATYAPAPTSPS